jgi:hypothetical protein
MLDIKNHYLIKAKMLMRILFDADYGNKDRALIYASRLLFRAQNISKYSLAKAQNTNENIVAVLVSRILDILSKYRAKYGENTEKI